MSQTMDQRRARWAWALTPGTPDDTYVSLADGTPATIMMDGLGQTVAFYLAKGKPHHKDVLKALASWLCDGFIHSGADPDGYLNQDGKTLGQDLMAHIMENDRDEYHTLTNEALTFLVWLKRFGKARQQDLPTPQNAAAHD